MELILEARTSLRLFALAALKNNKMKVFITGVAGFLGSHLAEEFLRQGYEVSGCDNLIGGYKDNVPEGVKFRLSNCQNLAEMLEETEGIDIVYHCAATAYEGLSVFSPSLISENIFFASATVISAAIQNKVKRFVLCSSMARYGTNKVPFTEEMAPNPQDPYGIAKVASEKLLECLARVHGMEYVIAVPHNIIGPRQKYDDPYRNVASIFINKMLRGEQPIIYGDGSQKRCFSFIQDDINPLVQMATSKVAVGEVINIGPDEEFVSIKELAVEIAKQIGFDLNPVYLPDRPQEVKEANCSADKARRLLDYRPTYSLADGIKEMIEYIKGRGTKPFQYHLPLEIINEKTPRSWREKLI